MHCIHMVDTLNCSLIPGTFICLSGIIVQMAFKCHGIHICLRMECAGQVYGLIGSEIVGGRQEYRVKIGYRAAACNLFAAG